MALTAARIADASDTAQRTGDGKIIERWQITVTDAIGTLTPGTGAGTTPTITAVAGSNDNTGAITVLTGSGSPATTAPIVTVNFAATQAVAPFVTISPGNDAAAALAIGAWPIVRPADTTTAAFIIRSGGTGLATTTTYVWNYDTNAVGSVVITPKYITRPVSIIGGGGANISVSGAAITFSMMESSVSGGLVDVLIEGY
jgi:hypothetical protein